MNKKILAALGLVAVAVAALFALRSSDERKQGPDGRADPGSGHETSTGLARGDDLPEPAHITGTVVDVAGSAIDGAQVVASRIEDAPAPAMNDAETSATTVDGSFELRGLPPGEYAVSAASADHLPAVQIVTLEAGDRRSIELTLEAGGALLSGTVRDLTGGTVAGAIVTIAPMRGALGVQERDVSAAISRDDGSYGLRLAPGRYRARVTHPDYVGASTVFDMTEGDRTLDLSLAPGGVIEGVALSADDRSPVPGAFVSYAVERSGDRPADGIAGVAVAEGDGSFRITGLSPGLVRLSARRGMLATADAEMVALGVAEQTSGVELLLAGARRVSGHVVVADTDEPAADVEVTARKPGGGAPVSATSDAEGRFELLGLPPGTYRVSTASETYFGDRLGIPVEVGDEPVDDLELQVRPGATVRGKVSPAGRAHVQAYQERETMQGSMRLPIMGGTTDTGENGTFEIGPLQPGSMELEARDASGRRGSVTIDVPAAGVDGVLIELEDGAVISGRVTSARGTPVADAVVRVRPPSTKGRVTMIVDGREITAFEGATDKDGNYAVAGIGEGEYEIAVVTGRGEPLRWANGDRTPRQARVAALEKKTLNLSVESRDGVIEGVVVDDGGQPVPDAWVRIVTPFDELPGVPDDDDVGESSSRMVMISEDGGAGTDGQRPPSLTDDSGRFHFAGLRDGTYSLVADAMRGGARGFARAKTGEPARIEVLTLTNLSGTVTLNGEPVTLFRVSLAGPSGISRSVRSDTGTFELSRIDPGAYTVTINANEGQGKAEVEVVPGEDASVAIELTRGVRVTGVLRSRGKPVAGAIAVAVEKRSEGRMTVEIDGDDIEGRTRADGRFEIGVAPGTYMMLFVDVQGGQGPIASRSLEVTGDEPVIDLGVVEAGEGEHDLGSDGAAHGDGDGDGDGDVGG